MSAATKKPATENRPASGALRVKRLLRAARPRFTRHAPHRKARLPDSWRRPRGLHNKQRDNRKGSLPCVSDGWRTPVSVRGLHSSGLAIAHVSTLVELERVDSKTHGVVIAS